QPFAGIRPPPPRPALQQRRLARPVGPAERGDPARLQYGADTVQPTANEQTCTPQASTAHNSASRRIRSKSHRKNSAPIRLSAIPRRSSVTSGSTRQIQSATSTSSAPASALGTINELGRRTDREIGRT